jgi:sec-independent protein translocase protein TatB
VLDVGFFEIIIVALACLLIVGPERLPVVFKTLGILVGRAQNYVSKVKSDVEKELNFSEYEATKTELKDFGKKYGEELLSLENEIHDLSSSIESSSESLSEEKIIRFHINSPKLSWREENFQLKIRERVRARIRLRCPKKSFSP